MSAHVFQSVPAKIQRHQDEAGKVTWSLPFTDNVEEWSDDRLAPLRDKGMLNPNMDAGLTCASDSLCPASKPA